MPVGSPFIAPPPHANDLTGDVPAALSGACHADLTPEHLCRSSGEEPLAQ
ncbi:Uncharacterised protein [Pannonibacter phragmitetus]|uniref:Uncharacterized protein n=1 Tax=Pannonibacter phragmitetus TaxID=121719 RepID=A0A378ZZF0_9HYPH|nr:Uncharacterised protein [Pannonibacter phragmitetus]